MYPPVTYLPLRRFSPPPHQILYPQRRRRMVMPPILMTRTRMTMSSTPKITRTTLTTFHLSTLLRPSSVPTRATAIATSCKSRRHARNPASVVAVGAPASTYPPQDQSVPSVPWKVSRPTSRLNAWRSPKRWKCSSTPPPVRPSYPIFRKCLRRRWIRGNLCRALVSNVASLLPSYPSWDF